MAYDRALWLPSVLRAAGLLVVEEPGWKRRGLSESRPFTPRFLVWHHDASARGDSPGVPDYMIGNFESAGAQIWVCAGCKGAHPSGAWHLIASGRAAHAGAVRSGMPDNETSLGIETDHTTGEKWDPALVESLRMGSAAIFLHMKTSASVGLHFHKSICYPVGRKVDPDGMRLSSERRRVADAMTALVTPTTPEEDDMALTDRFTVPASYEVAQAVHPGRDYDWTVEDAFRRMVEWTFKAQRDAEVARALAEARAAAPGPLSAAEIEAVVEKALADAVVNVSVSVTGTEPTQ